MNLVTYSSDNPYKLFYGKSSGDQTWFAVGLTANEQNIAFPVVSTDRSPSGDTTRRRIGLDGTLFNLPRLLSNRVSFQWSPSQYVLRPPGEKQVFCKVQYGNMALDGIVNDANYAKNNQCLWPLLAPVVVGSTLQYEIPCIDPRGSKRLYFCTAPVPTWFKKEFSTWSKIAQVGFWISTVEQYEAVSPWYPYYVRMCLYKADGTQWGYTNNHAVFDMSTLDNLIHQLVTFDWQPDDLPKNWGSKYLTLNFDSEPHSDLDIENVVSEVMTLTGRIKRPVTVVTEEQNLATLSVEAANSIRKVDVNTISEVKELFGLFGDLKTLLSTVMSKDWDKQKIASVYLSYKYGARLTIADARELFTALYRYYTSILPDVSSGRSRRTVVYTDPFKDRDIMTTVAMSAKIYYFVEPPEDLRSFIKILQDWDLYPSFQNIWDWIPYSFVLDWVADVEDYVSRLDAGVYISMLPIQSCTYSLHTQTVCPLDLLPLSSPLTGHVVYDDYFRFWTVEPFYTLSNIRVDFSQFSNWLEAGALIVQRFPTRSHRTVL